MTELSLDLPGAHLFVRSVSGRGIRVGEQYLTGSFVISPEQLISEWPPVEFGQLDESHFEPILALKPELVLLGTGSQQHFAHPSVLAPFYRAAIGVEVMTSLAACRTFNVLASEHRRVVAGILPIDEYPNEPA